MLDLSPVVLIDVLEEALYEHLLLLHCGVLILMSSKYISNLGCNTASKFLNTFVEHAKKIYGLEFLSYNVHMLCHISDDANHYGALDKYSAFPFENYLGQIKR